MSAALSAVPRAWYPQRESSLASTSMGIPVYPQGRGDWRVVVVCHAVMMMAMEMSNERRGATFVRLGGWARQSRRVVRRWLPSPIVVVLIAIMLALLLAVSLFRLGGDGSAANPLPSAQAASTDDADIHAVTTQEFVDETEASNTSSSTPPASMTPSPSASTIIVQVTGAVASPGVVEIPSGSRGRDAVDAAGGLSAEADLSTVNLARILTDGEHLHVFHHGEAPHILDLDNGGQRKDGQGNGDGSSAVVGHAACIDVRSASGADLDALPGVGPALAQRIIDYRQTHSLTSIDDLRNVSGIGAKTLERMRAKLCAFGQM